MKFGQKLHRYQVVEWTLFYIDYNRLKKLYKLAVERGENADFTGSLLTTFHLPYLILAQRSQLS